MRIVYIGSVDFSHHCLCEVLKNGGNVVGIVTSKNEKNNSDYHDLTPVSDQYSIPIHYCKNVNDLETINWIKDRNPDVIFCFGWSQIIESELLSLPPMGIIGVHPTLLPKNRGRHPIIWSLVLGLKEGGLTFFSMDDGVDSGPIISQERFKITSEDTAGTVYKTIKELATMQIAEFLPRILSRDYDTISQDSGKANYWRKRSAKDGVIDWRMNEVAILNLIRALTKPYPGAKFIYNEQVITVWEAHRYSQNIPSAIEPGKILSVSGGVPVIKCYDGAIAVDNYEPTVPFVEGEYII